MQSTWKTFLETFVSFVQTYFHTATVRAALAGTIDAVILSGANASRREERSEELSYDLCEAGFKFIPGMGTYLGTEESAIMVFPSDGRQFDDAEWAHLLRLGKRYHQESLMTIVLGTSNLQYLDGRSVALENIGDGFVTGDDASCQDACSTFAGITFSAVFARKAVAVEQPAFKTVSAPSPASNWA